jgi:class 3 adenylate cyclase
MLFEKRTAPLPAPRRCSQIVPRPLDDIRHTTGQEADMSWNRINAIERIQRIQHSIPAITVTPLQREMNLDNVTLGKPKRITGVHLYSAVTNEAAHITDLLDLSDCDSARAPTRTAHLWQRELNRVVCKDFDAAQIHFQGTRLHALVYRPVSDIAEIVGRAVVLAHALHITTAQAFNEILGDEANFALAAGAAFGETLATRSGSHGDSELLFIGDAANHGAKAIKTGTSLRVTSALAELIGGELDATLTEMDDGYVRVTMTHDAVKAAVERYKLDWSLDTSTGRIKDDLTNTPLDKVGISTASTAIDKGRLSLSDSKLNDAVSLFGDIDGFTSVVEAATDDADRERLIRHFHVARAEIRHVTTQDFGTLRVQYQGDRTQALDHLPHDDEAGRALHAVRLAAAWQSTMEDSLPAVIGNPDDIHLAIGLDAGPTIVSKLGQRGNRDMICLGKAVRLAAKIQGRLDGDEIGISQTVRDLLPGRVADLFPWDAAKKCYMAKGLRYNDVILAEEAGALDEGDGSNGSSVNIPAIGGATGDLTIPRRRWHP